MQQEEKQNVVIKTDVSKISVVKSLVWKFLERGGTQGVQFVIQIILARLLCPDDYGVLAILTAFIALANVFVQSGFNTALIQKKDADELDFSSVFWLSLFVAVVLYCILFFMAPFIANFYHKEILTSVLRVLSLILLFGALNSVQSAMVAKTMQFKRFFFSSMGGTIGSGIVGILFAYRGMGVWALVFQQLINNVLISIILWLTVDWHPHFSFSLCRIKYLFSFGWKLLCSSLLDTTFQQLYSLTIGKSYSSADLGYFNRGETFPSILTNNIDGSIQSVMLPTLSALNDKEDKLKAFTRKSIILSSFIMMPMMFGMVAASKSIVQVLLTDKWLQCVPYMQLACLYFAFYPIHTANLTAINALGRSDIYLKLEILKKILGVLILLITIPMGLIPMSIGRVIFGIVCTFLNSYPNKKLLKYTIFEQMQDIIISIILSLLMGVIVFFIGRLTLSPLFLLFLQILVGITVYVVLSYLFNKKVLLYCVETINKIVKGNK